MATMANDRVSGHQRRRVAMAVVAIVWVALVTAWLGWQTIAYAGLPAEAAEWEFARFGGSFPAANYVLLLLLFSIPAVLVFRRLTRRRDGEVRRGTVSGLLANALRVLRLLVGLAAGLGVLALVVLVEVALLPSTRGTPNRIDMAHVGQAVLPEGPAVIVGNFRDDRTALLDQQLLFIHRHYRFVPIQAGAATGSALRVFVEADAGEGRVAPSGQRTGILRRGSLPGEVVQLYRNAGYVVPSDHYVLYQDGGALYWPMLTALGRLLLALVVVGVAAWLTRRRIGRVRRRVLESFAGH